jgi:hypothetical protein
LVARTTMASHYSSKRGYQTRTRCDMMTSLGPDDGNTHKN